MVLIVAVSAAAAAAARSFLLPKGQTCAALQHPRGPGGRGAAKKPAKCVLLQPVPLLRAFVEPIFFRLIIDRHL